MKANKTTRAILFLAVFIAWPALGQSIKDQLTNLKTSFGFTFEQLETNSFFTEKYIVYLKQPLDHNNPQGETFTQRIFISHYNMNSPVVFITEGYGAGYAADPNYTNELSAILMANQVCVEHRFFGESLPKKAGWQYLNTFQAATDHHRAIELIKQIYKGSIVNTGISKGGQTAMFHRYYYPDDVAATVGYVCPLNFSIEDKRVYHFLNQVGDSISRNKILSYQLEMLENKQKYLPAFQALANKKNLTYPMGLLQGYELTVLEYAFAYWQWGTMPVDSIPHNHAEPEKMVKHLHDVAGIDWVSSEGINRLFPFFYQALTEIGFYGYDLSFFEGLVSFDNNPTFAFTIPDSIQYQYNPEAMQKVDFFIRHEAERMIFIYGELDPWSATGVDITYNGTVFKVIKPGGSHLTRISNLPEHNQQFVIETLKDWLKVY